jgi:hypothetical protein
MPRRTEQSPDEAGFDVSWWDDGLGKMVSWADRQTPDYRRMEAARNFQDWRHPIIWVEQALQLHEVAEFQWRTYEKHRGEFPTENTPPISSLPNVTLMLAGMSFECALKAYLLCRHDWPITDNQLRSVAKGAHNLAELLALTGMRHNRMDRETLRQLTEFVRWSGRYPIPQGVAELEDSYTSHRHSHEELWQRYEQIKAKFAQRIIRETERYIRRSRRQSR